MSDSAEGTSEETAPSRYFTKTDADLSGKSRGRKSPPAPKKPAMQVRHDVEEDVPVDGDYEKLELENEDPDMEYFRVSDFDLKRLRRPWVPLRWGPGTEPKWWFGEKPAGEIIKIDGLTFMQMPKAVWAQIKNRDSRRTAHRQRMAALKTYAQQNGQYEHKVSTVSAGDFVVPDTEG